MTENKSKISEALKNFCEFFSPASHAQNIWFGYCPSDIAPVDREAKDFVYGLIRGIEQKSKRNPLSPLWRILEIAESYKDQYFDPSLEEEMRERFLKIARLFGCDYDDPYDDDEKCFLTSLVRETSKLRQEGNLEVNSALEPLKQWIEGELAKIDFEEIKSILIDFRDKSALRKELKIVQEINGNAASKEAATNFAKLYKEVRDELREEISPVLFKKKSKEYESEAKPKLKACSCERLWFVVKELKRFFFSLKSKIFFLRLLVYTIPALIFTFHFCQFLKIPCDVCSWFPPVQKELVAADAGLMANSNLAKATTKKSTQQSEIYNESNAANESGLYLRIYLPLVTIFLVAFQQMRSAIKDLNIKKNLFETYRHRVLVAENFNLFRTAVDGDSKNEVVKSAVAALFANEPSIYENRPSPTPPNAFDIKNFVNKSN